MIETILPILREASKVILDIYADEDRFNTEIKSDLSPLTEADRRSNKLICDRLADLFPDVPVISEEAQHAIYDIRSTYKKYFLVDPLDGTKEFIKRNGEFTINIAYLEDHAPLGGYVFVPTTGKAYLAERSSGAYRVDADGAKSVLRSKSFFLMDEGLNVVASRSHLSPLTDRIISQLNRPVLVSAGSALKFLLIAEGKANFYPRLAPTMEWDTAAAQCILQEAGGSVLRFDRLTPLVYNKPDLLNPHFIATGALLDPESLVDLIEGLKSY